MQPITPAQLPIHYAPAVKGLTEINSQKIVMMAVCTVASLVDRPGWYPPGCNTRKKLFSWLNLVFFKIQPPKILVGCHPLEAVTRGGKETTAKKKKETPSVAARGDTNPSEATVFALTIATDDWDVFAMVTAMRVPAIASTFHQWHLAACTVQVVQPDSTWTAAVVMMHMQTGSPVRA